MTNAEILNSDVEMKNTLQDEAVANANEVFKTGADKDLYERAMDWAEKFTNGSNSATLNETDTRAILDYMSSGVAYSLNAALRTGQELTEAQKTIVKNLDTALEKLPDYAGTVYRSVSTEMIEDPVAFLAQYQKDNIVRSLAYTSTGKDVYDPDMKIQYVITAKHGKDISDLNKNEQEAERKEAMPLWKRATRRLRARRSAA
ncbi:MAG: hypothetical protein LUD84_06435 [Clostridiales bacterium]|nr:hypothetical protein [Clostridiales bacterium]